ncbi:MAG: MopE-related protein, partial [Candidatus Woesearchaeota archaeon]|nr:MopE-related protein [Candidatus Woesearchaeota archaeon]
ARAGDCNDNNANINPGKAETCNGIDDNCNSQIDESLTAPNCDLTQGVCFGKKKACGGLQGWLSCTASTYGADYESIETRCDKKDNDCDGQTDEGCPCTDGQTQNITCGSGDCMQQATQTCVNGRWQGTCAPLQLKKFYLDSDNDGYGIESSFREQCAKPFGYAEEKGDCNDTNSSINPKAEERCGIADMNCNGKNGIDEGKCSCDDIKAMLFSANPVTIAQPKAGSNYSVNERVSFVASSDKGITGFSWDFGDGSKRLDVTEKGAYHEYASPGTYTIKLTSYFNTGCSMADSISINIIKPENIGLIPPQAVSIEITSPKNNEIIRSSDFLLSYLANPPNTICSYSLNNDPSYTTIYSRNINLKGREGSNKVSVKCNETIASVNFFINTTQEKKGIFNDIMGNATEPIFKPAKAEEIPKMNITKIMGLAVDVIDYYDFSITRIVENVGNTSILTFSISNKMDVAAYFIEIIAKIPKDIAGTADEISAKGNMTVIEQDPVIKFDIEKIAPNGFEELKLFMQKPISQEMLEKISIEPRINKTLLAKKIMETQDALKPTVKVEEFTKDGETYTKVILSIDPKKSLDGVSLFAEIPKCLANSIDDLDIDPKVKEQIKAVKTDPIIMWQFDKLESQKEFSFNVKGKLSKECIEQIRLAGLAEKIGLESLEKKSMLQMALALMAIPLVGVIIFFTNRFSARKEEEIREEEKGKEAKKEIPKQEAKKPTFEERLDTEIEKARKELMEILKK